MKPTWIYEHGVFGRKEEQPEADELFVAALRKHGLEVLEFDKNSILKADFTPSRAGDHHELKVVELGSYHCAGVYASDLDKYIEAANDFAIKMSNEDDN